MDIDYATAMEIAGILGTELSNITDEFTAITGYFNQINDGTGLWDGTVASNVSAQFTDISSHFTEFQDAIQTCKDNLDTIIANYQAADAKLNNLGNQQ